MIEIKNFDHCPKEAMDIRISVFCDEQGVGDGYDEIDAEAVHFVAFEDGTPVGTCRIIRHDEQSFFFSRLAVLSSHRGKSIGSLILKSVEEYVLSQNARRIFLRTRENTKIFYEKCGFSAYGDLVFKEGFPRVYVEKNLFPVTHDLNLNPEPFELISKGLKIYELRLDDEKRKYIYTGDVIAFHHTKNSSVITCKVLALHHFPTFEELYKRLPLDKCGYTEESISTAHPSDMEKYYSRERQAAYGVLGIEIKLIEK